MEQCERCGVKGKAMTMSRFNTEMICCGEGSCVEKERSHPQYLKAAEVELAAIQSGNMNFPGIGKPSDL